MDGVIDGIGVFATAILLGAMVFFSAVIAPLIFIKLEADVAGRFIRQVFPWYYLTVIVLGSLAAAAFLIVRPPQGLALACVAIAAVGARQVLMPRINRERDRATAGDSAAARRFARLHRLSVGINLAQMAAAAGVLASLLPALG